MSAALTQSGIVNRALKPAVSRGKRMVENVKALSFSELLSAACSAISACGIVGGFVMWMSGAFAGATLAANELTALKGQVSGISAQMTKIQDQIQAGPRMDTLNSIIEENTRQNARIDLLREEIGSLKTELMRTSTRLEGIDAASRAQLPLRR